MTQQIQGNYEHTGISCYLYLISYGVVGKLSQTLADLRVEDLTTVKHFLRYLKGNFTLTYRRSDAEPLRLTAYSDSDWANSEDRKPHRILLLFE